MKRISALALALMVRPIVEETLEAFDPEELLEAVEDYQELTETSEDDAIRAVAKGFDDAFDWEEALERHGYVGEIAGQILEAVDEWVWYAAIKLHVYTMKRRTRRGGIRPRKLHRTLRKKLGLAA